MDVRTISDTRELEQLRDSWDAIYDADPDAHYFTSWRWLDAARRAHPDGWQVYAVASDGPDARPVCLLAARVAPRWSARRQAVVEELSMAGRRSWGQYNGFLCDPDWDTRAVPALARHLVASPLTKLSLKYFRTTDARWALFTDEFPTDEFRIEDQARVVNDTVNNLVCPYVELPASYDAYLTGQVSRSTRQRIRRFGRRVADDDELSLTYADAETMDRDIDALLDLWQRQWAHVRGERTARVAKKYGEILRLSAGCEGLHLVILRRGDTPIGALAAFHDDRKHQMFYIVSSRDTAGDDGFIGWVLHGDTLRWAIEHSVTRYDFCHGNEPYKYSYGSTDRTVRYTTIRRRTRPTLSTARPLAELSDA